MRRLAAIAAACALPIDPALAKPGTPGPDYFVGAYEAIGRDGAGQLVSAGAQIAANGAGLRVTFCAAPELTLSFGPAFEIPNLMTGRQAGAATECLFHNNGYNYPILTCRSESGAAMTLWPKQDALPCK